MEKEQTKENINVKLYPIYKAISWDLLFFYTILFLFLTQVKGISASDVLLAEACYPIFKFVLLMPLTVQIERIGKRKSLIIGNLVNAISVMFFIVGNNLWLIIVAQFFSAIAFDIKGLAETNLLYDSIPRDEKRGSKFSKMDGRGVAGYYTLDAISSAVTGFMYVVHPYIPMFLALATCFISAFIAYKFKEVEKEKTEIVSTRKYIKDLRSSFKYMFQSGRLKYLIIFGSIFSGLLGVLVSLRSGSLEEIGVPEQYFGLIFAGLGIISAICARLQNKIHNHFHNKTLAVIALPACASCILVGFLVALNLPYTPTLCVMIILFAAQFFAKGPFYTLIKRYLNNFTNHSLRGKISSCYNMMESLARSIISLFASFLLKGINSAGTMCVIGCILTIVIVLLLDRMSHKVGLKPEEYKKNEIDFLEIK